MPILSSQMSADTTLITRPFTALSKRLQQQLDALTLAFTTYAVAAIQSGDDIKTVQSNLGYATAAFTLDVYGHVTEQMKQASSERMDNFIKSVSGGEK